MPCATQKSVQALSDEGKKKPQQLTKEQTIIGNPQGQQRQLAVVFDAAIAFKGAVYTW